MSEPVRSGPDAGLDEHVEDPLEDVVEQRTGLLPDEAGGEQALEASGDEVDPADAAEQRREVPYDDDEWR